MSSTRRTAPSLHTLVALRHLIKSCFLMQARECRKPAPPLDRCQSCCKINLIEQHSFIALTPTSSLSLLSEWKYHWFTCAISGAEGANFSLTIGVMVQKSNAIRAHCLSPPAQFNYSRAADNYCLAISDAWLMSDIMTRSHLMLPHPCRSFHWLRKTKACNTRRILL